MRNTIFALLGIVAGAIALAGCSETKGQGGGDGNGDGNGNGNGDGNGDGSGQLAPSFPEGTGQQAQSSLTYPEAPYGIGKGSVVANYKFVGYPNAMKVSDSLQEIQLAEFYNPTGDGVYEAGSKFEVGSPKPKALLINVSSVWCGPCNFEAAEILPGLYAKYKPLGGEFFLQIADGPTPGKAATTKSLYNWTQKYDVDYPSSVDPTYKLGALFEADAFPANMIIDARTMKIVDVVSGAPEEGGSFWKTYEKVIAGTL